MLKHSGSNPKSLLSQFKYNIDIWALDNKEEYDQEPPYQMQACVAPNPLLHKCKLSVKSRPSAVQKTNFIFMMSRESLHRKTLFKLLLSGLRVIQLKITFDDAELFAQELVSLREQMARINRRHARPVPITLILETMGSVVLTGNLNLRSVFP